MSSSNAVPKAGAWWRIIMAAGAFVMLPGIWSAPASAQSAAVATLLGTWNGSGRISYTDGSSEAIRCTAYNTGGGNNLKLSIQCKSDKNPIHIRSDLTIEGSRANGKWEERTFNASGAATGSVGQSNMQLSVTGGGFNGTMAVTFSRASLSIAITTQGIAMSRASMGLSRQQ